jgi:hypothetical protein
MVGIHGSTFYRVLPPPATSFFPFVHQPFLGASQEAFSYLLHSDALAVYIGATAASVASMRDLLQRPFTSHDDWLATAASLYDVVLLTSGDGSSIRLYTTESSHLRSIHSILSKIERSIEQLGWYRQHAQVMRWDSEYDLCLKLPAG